MITDRKSAALTERRIRAAKPRAEAWTLWDAGIKGFGVRTSPGGTSGARGPSEIEEPTIATSRHSVTGELTL